MSDSPEYTCTIGWQGELGSVKGSPLTWQVDAAGLIDSSAPSVPCIVWAMHMQ